MSVFNGQEKSNIDYWAIMTWEYQYLMIIHADKYIPPPYDLIVPTTIETNHQSVDRLIWSTDNNYISYKL
jgi:hypothetical protein